MKTRLARPEFMSLTDYLEQCREDPSLYASAPERLLKAIGEPQVINTALAGDPRLSRLYQNRTIRIYPSFDGFYGMESTIDEIVNFAKAAAQGLEARKQILYLLGPVGGGKSSLAEKLKELMEREAIYALAVPAQDRNGEVKSGEYVLSPIYESPLGLFPKSEAAELEKTYGIPARYFEGICSPWATKRLTEFEGDVTKFMVAKLYPSRIREIAIAKTEPGDENNQDISSLVGKVDVRKLERYAIDDPDAYSYSGALCRASQGMMEFVEMFKAPIKTLHPLLTATQDRNFSGTEPIGMIPFRGMIIAHSNEAEWEKFRSDQRNEAFLDRVQVVRVKYNLRISEEENIYRKLLRESALSDIPVAPFTFGFLARTVIASRLKPTTKVKSWQKVLIYDGRDLRDEVPNAPMLGDLVDEAGFEEGMAGISTRLAFKVLAEAANDGDEIALDPIELQKVMKTRFARELGSDAKPTLTFIEEQLKGWLLDVLGDVIKESLLENYDAFAQNRFERYFQQALIWTDRTAQSYPDPDTGQMINKTELEQRLREIETPAGVASGDEFRHQVVHFVQQYKLQHGGHMPDWKEYEPMKRVIKALVEKHTTDLLPVIGFEPKRDTELQKKHDDFVGRMRDRGFTPRQVKRVVSWYLSSRKSS